MTDRLKDAFVEGLGIELDATDWENLAYGSISQWNSVAHMALASEIEDAFGITLSTDDVLAMTSFSEARNILARYGIDV